jgi:hypothetical protein
MSILTKNELEYIILKHEAWLESGRKIGERANLKGANLKGANFRGANLKGANFRGANLKGEPLKGEPLKGASLYGADFEGANLEGADFEGANLDGAYFEGANFDGANLYGANLYGANIEYAKGIMQFGSIGETRRTGYAVLHDTTVMFKLGCFWGDTEATVKAVRNKYGQDSLYEQQIILSVKILEAQRNE